MLTLTIWSLQYTKSEQSNNEEWLIISFFHYYKHRVQVGIYLKYGYHTLSRVLRLIIATWEGDLNSFSANMLKGVAKLVVAYGDSLNDEVFKEKLGAISIKLLTRTAKERRPGSMGFAEAMVLEYNGRKETIPNIV